MLLDLSLADAWALADPEPVQFIQQILIDHSVCDSMFDARDYNLEQQVKFKKSLLF